MEPLVHLWVKDICGIKEWGEGGGERQHWWAFAHV